LVLPGILSTGVKWYILKKDTGRGTHVLSSMLYNQLVLTFVVTAIGLIALIATNPSSVLLKSVKNERVLPVVCGVLLAMTLLMWLLLLSARVGRTIVKAMGMLLTLLPQKVRRKGQEVLGQITAFQTAGVWFHLKVAALTTVAGLAMCIFSYDAAGKAANINVSIGVFIWLSALIFTLGRLPISVANLGVREVTLVGVLAFYGVDKPTALLMSMVLFLSLIFMAVIGAVYQFCWAVGTKSPDPQDKPEG
jgi:uncharacterized membrane protein YbhN (UPF0104 family)